MFTFLLKLLIITLFKELTLKIKKNILIYCYLRLIANNSCRQRKCIVCISNVFSF